ncbi:MAG: septum formation initiator [Actinoplanes sp.]
MRIRLPRRPAVAVLGWLAAAAVATLVGLGGIQLVGSSLTGTPGGVLSQDDIARALALPTSAAPTTAAAPTRTATSAPPRGQQRVFSVSGGRAVATCRADGRAYLDSWSPSPGYQVDKHEQGPDHEVEVRFEGADGRSELKISCQGGTPVAERKDDS